MAVYTKITEAEIAKHLESYSLGELVNLTEIVDGIDNSNFILETTEGKFILTIFESRIDPNELSFFINLKLHLAQKGICCPDPVLNKAGQSIADLKGKKAAIVTFLSGSMLKTRDDGLYDCITAKHCFEIGKVTSQLHLAAADFNMSRFNDSGINGWNDLVAKFSHLIENYQPGLKDEIEKDLEFLKTSWNSGLPSAPAHLDLFPDNVFFDENANVSGVIDFYFAANDALIYDFAIIVNAWCFDENNNFQQEKFDEMLRGYEEARTFSESEKAFLNIALMGASMRFLLTRMHDKFFTPEGSLVKVKDPQEYLEKLRFFKAKLCQ